MSRLIDANFTVFAAECEFSEEDAAKVRWLISHIPTVDAVEVVRCKDCLNAMKMKKQLCKGLHYREDAMVCGMIGHVVLPEDYCSSGVKMDAEVEG